MPVSQIVTNSIAPGQTITSPVFAGTPTGVGVLTAATAQASTSGTSIDFTGIPSWVRRVTVMFNGVSTNGNSGFGFQVGAGSVVTTGYTGSSWNSAGTAIATNTLSASVYNQASINSAAAVNQGIVTFVLLGSNVWAFSLNSSRSESAQTGLTVGTIALSGALDRVRMLTVNGTDTFDAGTINIMYE